jgi:hypothetical protein
MKTKINTYLKLGILLFGISLFMTNCNNDDESVMDESQLDQTTPLVLSQKIPFNEAMHFNKLETKISEIKDKLNNPTLQNRVGESEDIIILTDEVSYTTYAGTYTYTFKILREQPQAFIENIVLHYNIETNNYDEYLMQYHLQADEFMSLHQGDFLQSSDSVVITPLEQGFFNNQVLGRDCGIVCETIWESCSSGQHHSGNVSSWGGCTASSGPSVHQECYSTCNEISVGASNTGGGISASGGDSTAVISNPYPTEPCDSNSTGGNGFTGGDDNEKCIDMDAYALQIALEEDPFLLLEIDCDQIQKWQSIAQHEPPWSVKAKINNLPSSFLNNFDFQLITDANGTIVNMDYFAVNVTTLPNNPITGQQFSADEFLDYFRRNINTFSEDSGSEFEPYCNIPSMCQLETDLWNSNSPLGAIIYIDIPIDDGVVVCTEYTNSYWYFMTMNAPYAGNHPVSGTRQFGYEQGFDGSYNFFVRGVDRFNSFIHSDIAEVFTQTDPFLGADLLWLTFKQNLNTFVNNNGGVSSEMKSVKSRPNWYKVKEVLLGNKPISELGCE